jgi:hypothetical protein
LHRVRYLKEFVHGPNFLNQACCSTSPEVGAGVKCSRHDSKAPARLMSAFCVSISRSSRLLIEESAAAALFQVSTQRFMSCAESSCIA